MILDQILTILGTEICFNTSLKCTKFQLDWSTHLYFMADFAKCVKRSRRNPPPPPQNFGHLYLGNGWGDFLHISYVDSSTVRELLYQVWFQLDKRSRSYICVKIALSSCQYTHGVVHWLLGPHDTLPCVLIARFCLYGPYLKCISKINTCINHKFHVWGIIICQYKGLHECF